MNLGDYAPPTSQRLNEDARKPMLRREGGKRCLSVKQRTSMVIVAEQCDVLVQLVKSKGKSIKNMDHQVEYSLEGLISHWENESTSSTAASTLGSSYQSLFQDGGSEEVGNSGSVRSSSFYSRASHIDTSLFDVDEQRKELEFFEEQQKQRVGLVGLDHQEYDRDESEQDNSNSEELDNEGEDMIEVTPGVNMPLRRSFETWQAIMDGRVIVTKCYSCTSELGCIDDAELVICADCWVFNPIDQNIASVSRERDQTSRVVRGVGIGVKLEDIVEWMSNPEAR
jgi:hypothetical protein